MTVTLHRRTATALATVAVTVCTALGATAVPAQAAPTEHISNGTFSSNTSPWWSTANVTLANSSGQMCAEVEADTTNKWDAIVGYGGVPLTKGDKYTVEFTASASVPTTIRAVAQLNVDPYTATFDRNVELTSEAETYSYTFISSLDVTDGAFQFQIGGSAEAWRFCVDDVSVSSEAQALEPTGPELVTDGTFDAQGSWFAYGTDSGAATDGQFCAVPTAGLENVWDAGVGVNGVSLTEGETYVFSFEASTDPAATVRPVVQLGEDPYTAYFVDSVEMTDEMTEYTYSFIASADTDIAQVAFQIGGAADTYTFCVDNVSLRSAA